MNDQIRLQVKHTIQVLNPKEVSTTDDFQPVTTENYKCELISNTEIPGPVTLLNREKASSSYHLEDSAVKNVPNGLDSNSSTDQTLDKENEVSSSRERVWPGMSLKERKRDRNLVNARINREIPAFRLMVNTEVATEIIESEVNNDEDPVDEMSQSLFSQDLMFLPSHRADQKTTKDNDQLSNVTPPGSSLFGVFLTAFLVLFGVFVWILIYNRRLDIDYYNRSVRSYQCVDKDVFLDSSENELFRR